MYVLNVEVQWPFDGCDRSRETDVQGQIPQAIVISSYALQWRVGLVRTRRGGSGRLELVGEVPVGHVLHEPVTGSLHARVGRVVERLLARLLREAHIQLELTKSIFIHGDF